MVIDMTKSRFQLRGHCQRCGNQQAVKNGTMVHHGYTVRNGWFQGACSGHSFKPIEWSRTTLDKTVEAIRDQIVNLRQGASMMSSKVYWPTTAVVYNRFTRQNETVTLADLPEPKAREIVQGQIDERLNRARAGEAHIAYLLEVASLYHGKDLIEVERDAGPEKIIPGEARTSKTGRTLYAEGILHGGKVQYSYKQANGTEMFGNMSTRAWRVLAKAS